MFNLLLTLRKLPLSDSVTDPGTLHAEGTEKNIGLINGISV